MDCGAEEIACQAISLITDNELAASALLKLVGQTGEQAAGLIGFIGAFLKEHGEKLVAAAGFSFGVWRWWRYRERILHKRRRLIGGQTYILNALERPGPSRPPKSPLFASRRLRKVLQNCNWDSTAMALSATSSADAQLSEAAEIINRQLETASAALASLREQHTTVNILRGAIAASQPGGKRIDETAALAFFRTALSVPGHDKNIIAKELIGHQYRKLGLLNDALEAFEEIQASAKCINDERERDLVIARAKRYQGEILQSMTAVPVNDGGFTLSGCRNAHVLLYTNPDSALNIRSRHAPYSGWDQLEQGDLHYLAAFVASMIDARNIEARQLMDAATAYQSVLSERGRWYWRWRSASRRLNARARQGLARVADAENPNSIYDVKWLFPALAARPQPPPLLNQS